MLLAFVPSRLTPSGTKRPAWVKAPYNGIRPFKGARPGEPLPEPLPPAPLLGPRALLGIGALVLAQIWGLLGSRPKTSVPVPLPGGIKIKGTVPPLGNGVGATLRYRRGSGTSEYCMNSSCTIKQSETIASPVWYTAGNVFGVADVVAEMITGRVKTVRLALEQANGSLINSELLYGQSFGYTDLSPGIETEWLGPGAVQWQPEMLPTPLPEGWKPEPLPEAVPVLPSVVPLPSAPPLPEPLPEAEPVRVPVTPGPTRPAVPAVPSPPTYTPIRPPGYVSINNGVVVPPAPAPIPVTPSDVVFPVPGGAPVGGPGQSPRPDLVGVAQEVGKIERKLEGLLNPKDPEVNPVPEWLSDLGKIADLLSGLLGGGSYTLTEPCDPDGDGVFVKREIQYDGALGMLGLLSNKIDALAQLQQAAKDLRQPICPGRKPWGELVSVRFVSLENSSAGERPLRKEFRYRDQTLSDQCAHANHWEGFEWQAGPYCVRSTRLSWGEPQVWAATPGEGKRVIGHAAAIAGVDLNDPKHRWSVSTSQNPRYGRSGRMVPARKAVNSIWVTKRDGPSGLPEFPISV